MMLLEHLAVGLVAEKYVVGKFGISNRHWIKEKIQMHMKSLFHVYFISQFKI